MFIISCDHCAQAKVAHKRAGRKDLYAILGVTSNASDDEIKRAYKKKALQYHPDKNSSKTDEEKAEAEAMFKGIGEAYEVLTDPEKKQRYDEGVDVEDLDGCCGGGGGGGGCGGGGGFRGGGGGMDPDLMYHIFMQQQQQQRGGGGGRRR